MFTVQFEIWPWLFPLAITIHNLEEAIWMPGWSVKSNVSRIKGGAFEFRFAVIVLTILAYIATAMAAVNGRQSWSAYIYTGFVFGMLVNVFIPHLAISAKMKRYTPGVGSAVLIILPVTSFILWKTLKLNYVSGIRFWLTSAAVFAVLLTSIPILFKTGKLLKRIIH